MCVGRGKEKLLTAQYKSGFNRLNKGLSENAVCLQYIAEILQDFNNILGKRYYFPAAFL